MTLPSVTPRQVLAALKRDGFQVQRQRGSHLFLWHPVRDVITTVPFHAKDLPRGTLRAILKQAGLSDDEFKDLLF